MVINSGLWYELPGNYYFPCLTVPAEAEQSVDIWGQRHKQYLKEHCPAIYDALLLSSKLSSYLSDIDHQAEARLSRLIEQTAKQEGITEQFKAKKQMDWVRKKVRNARGFSYRRICGHLLAKTWVDTFVL